MSSEWKIKRYVTVDSNGPEHAEQTEMKEQITGIKQIQDDMRQEHTEISTLTDKRHREIMDQFNIFKAD